MLNNPVVWYDKHMYIINLHTLKSSGISRDKTMTDKWCTSPMIIHKITPYVHFDFWTLLVWTNQSEFNRSNQRFLSQPAKESNIPFLPGDNIKYTLVSWYSIV